MTPIKVPWLFKIPFLTLLIATPFVLWLGFGDQGFIKLYEARLDRDAQLETIRQLSRENQALLDEINSLRNDMGYVETVARKELNLIKEDEIIYRFDRKEKPE